MPLYEYQCDACGKRFEAIQKFSDAVLDVCRLCGQGPVKRLLSSPAIQFKGSGWYITDYSQKGKEPGKKSGEKTSGDAARGDSAKPDSSGTKSESKSESAASANTSAATKPDSSQ
jgi:putative FmdB family regulatory protein